MNKLRALWRFLFFVFYTCYKIGQMIFSSLLMGHDIRRSMRIRQEWSRYLLPTIGVQVKINGTAPDYPCIIMSNHRSYLDPAVLVYDANVYGVSKAEVAKWPIIGFGAKVSGVLFLKRESAESRKKTLAGIAEKLNEGFPILLFPEGTTHSEPTTASFKPGGFKLAASEGYPVVPVAIDYSSTEDYWVGKDTFLPHFFRRFSQPKIWVQVRFGEAIWSDNPQELLDETKQWIDSELVDIRGSWQV